MATVQACPVVIKVPIGAPRKASAMPAVAARLRARAPPVRAPTSPEVVARKELLRASEIARRAAIAQAHNDRVAFKVENAAQLRAETNDYARTSIDRRLQKSEAKRSEVLSAVKAKAQRDVARVAEVHERLESRKVALATSIERGLEHAEEMRRRRLRNVQFRASLTAHKQKAAKTAHEARSADLSAKIQYALDSAEKNRAGFLSARKEKAAKVTTNHAAAVRRAKETAEAEARARAASLDSRLQAADYLRALALKLRQSKAALANEHAVCVSRRRKLSETVEPMLRAAKVKADLYLASERRGEALDTVAMKAASVVKKVVRTVARREVEEQDRTRAARASLEERLAAAGARKEELYAARATAGGGPCVVSTPSPRGAGAGGGSPFSPGLAVRSPRLRPSSAPASPVGSPCPA